MTVEEAVNAYADLLYRVCLVMLCDEQDAQDAVQDVFVRYMERRPVFEGTEHEKAWLLKVAANRCRDMLRFRARHRAVSIDELAERYAPGEHREALSELMELPPKLKAVIYFHYVEGYRIGEIAGMLGISEAAVKKRLQRGREKLRQLWKEEQNG